VCVAFACAFVYTLVRNASFSVE